MQPPYCLAERTPGTAAACRRGGEIWLPYAVGSIRGPDGPTSRSRELVSVGWKPPGMGLAGPIVITSLSLRRPEGVVFHFYQKEEADSSSISYMVALICTAKAGVTPIVQYYVSTNVS